MTASNDDLLDPEPLESSKFPADFAGQSLFIRGDDWHNNAMLGWTHFPLDLYASGYKDAADGLLYALAERRVSLDSVIYPLMFLYRQGLELELKLMVPLARRLADMPEKKDHSHGLMPLWKELRDLLDRLDPREDDKQLPAMETFIQQLDTVDPESFAFRYPTTKKGAESLPGLRYMNVRHLSEIMDSVYRMMSGIHSWLAEIEQNNDF